MRKRCFIILLIIVVLVTCMSFTVGATDMSSATIKNMKTLLFIMGEATSSFKPSLTVATTFEPSYFDMDIDRLINYARDVDPFTGSLLYSVKWSVKPSDDKYIVNFEFSYYITEQQYKELQQFASDFSNKLIGKDDYWKIRETHDYLVENCTYDINMDGPYNCLFKNRSNCNGYALAFYLIMRECGIECKYVYGADHACNTVKLGPFWYNIDVTWDDTDDKLSYDYFLKGRGDWKGHDKNTATAGYSYSVYNEFDNLTKTIYYWCKWPVIMALAFMLWSRYDKKRVIV